MCSPEKEYYSLEEIAKKWEKWGLTVEDALYFGGTGQLEICVYVYKGSYLLCEEKWSREKEQEKRRISSPNSIFMGDKMILLSEGLYPAWLLPGDWIPPGQLGPKSLQHPREPLTIKIMHAEKEGHAHLDEGEYRDSLFITHEELERFKAAYELTNNAIKKKRPTHRIRSNEIHEVIWRAYCDLKERYKAPTSGQIWQKLQGNYRKYDTEEIINEISREIIVWTNYKGSRRTLKESSFKGTLSNIKKKRNISKNSN